MKVNKTIKVLFSGLLLLGVSSVLTSCGESKYEFEFAGSAEFSNGKTYTARIKGNKDEEKTFTLTVDENEALELDGNWVYVENKGYKLYFDDADENYVYTKYNVDSKEFSFNYTLNLGGGFGTGKIKFTGKDTKFASIYDGKGLGMHPPLFTGGGWGSSYATSWRVTNLTCYEDGTCVSTCVYKGVTRAGTWTYNETINQYSFEFKPENYTYIRSMGVWTSPGNSYNQDFGGQDTYRHCYWEGDFKSSSELKAAGSTDNKPGRTELWLKSEGPRNYSTSTYQNGNKNEIEYKTTYDKETKTYTLIYEQIDSFYYVDRIVEYTLED